METAILPSGTGSLFVEGSTALSVLVAILIGVISVCVCVAGTLAFMQYKETTFADNNTLAAGRDGVQQGSMLSPVKPSSSASSLRQLAMKGSHEGSSSLPSGLLAAGGSTGGGHRAPPRKWLGGGSGAGATRSGSSVGAANPPTPADILDSLYDTQETMDSAMVQEILGSVDANTIFETQVLLTSVNWDMDQLLQQELCSQGRA